MLKPVSRALGHVGVLALACACLVAPTTAHAVESLAVNLDGAALA